MRAIRGNVSWLTVALAVVGGVSNLAAAGNRWALLVGVDQYIKVNSLEYAGNDQRSLAAQLAALDFPEDQVFLLHDLAKQKRNLPFRENIERDLSLVLRMAKEGDTLLVAFSGHGVYLNGESYLCPTETDLDRPEETLISLDRTFDSLSKCKAALKIMLVDACRNDPRPPGTRAASKNRSVTDGFEKSLENPPAGVLLLTSCAVGQFSREDAKLQHGVFMFNVLEGLKGKAANSDGVITLNSLYDYTSLATQKYVAKRWSDAQSPGLKGELTGPVELAHINRAAQRVAESRAEQAEDPEKSGITGIWNGQFADEIDSKPVSVNFSMIVIQDGANLSGFIKEQKTFGQGNDPYLHSSFRGTYDETTLRINWVKTYDGTANIDHDVQYGGRLSGDGKHVLNGAWKIANAPGREGRFTLAKDDSTHAGKWSGVWSGTNYYSESSKRPPAKFSMIVAEKGPQLRGFINERRTSGAGDDPWFHATVSGQFDDASGEATFTTTYDGTAGRTDQIEYRGKLSEDQAGALVGTWKTTKGAGGNFTLVKSPPTR